MFLTESGFPVRSRPTRFGFAHSQTGAGTPPFLSWRREKVPHRHCNILGSNTVLVPVTQPAGRAGPPAIPGLLTHVPELDGIRGVAVTLVVLYHLNVIGGVGADSIYGSPAKLGWCGVDLFFVLSGLLITGILLDSRDDPGYFQKFYARRVLRIFPLYYAVVAGLFVLGPLTLRLLSRNDLIAVWVRPNSQTFAWTFTLNILFAFDPSRVSQLIQPLWSLSVEEQFYLAWPLFVLWLKPDRLRQVCVALILISFAIRTAVAFSGNTLAAYTLTPCRFDALAVGGLLALMLRSPRGVEQLRVWCSKLAVASAAAFGLLAAFTGTDLEHPLVVAAGILLLDLLFASGMAAMLTAPESSPLRIPFRWSPLRTIGKHSYAMYLFHQGIIVVLGYENITGRLTAVLHSALLGQLAFSVFAAGLSFGAALASWWLLEKRFLALKRYFPY